MNIENDRKCNVCGAHAPMHVANGDLLKRMTCEVTGPWSDFPYIKGVPAAPPRPAPKNRMTQSEFESFVAARWNAYTADDGLLPIPTWDEMDEIRQATILSFALALINDLPN